MPLSSTCQWNGPELMAVISPDLPDVEWECSDHVVNEVDGICLGVAFVDFEGAYTGCVVDGRDLEAPDLLASFPDECQELDIHLDVMAWNLLIVALGAHLADARSPWQPI